MVAIFYFMVAIFFFFGLMNMMSQGQAVTVKVSDSIW